MNANKNSIYKFPFEEYSSEAALSEQEQELIKKAREAAQDAYSQYSKFSVGAAVLLKNGEIITGSNQENAAYPSGLCAERVALFYAASQYPDVPVKKLVVTALRKQKPIKEPVPPCGSCRQVFIEWEKRFGQPFEVIMAGTRKIIKIKQAGWLLPFNFQADFL
ncbi:cytidine deaminase [Marinilabilia rubra]|uniref:Cytidine deaminase n=1 Tax=Marinilabilia rubra TaxID=2162893 RepID=A0A2U2B7Q7_9BACT|nr:cytidine deaminase [Marinilabilia rubra]PWD99082.1 cytidine deaminase [Marinilabilia rubra]